MRVERLGTIEWVTSRDYTRKDGTQGTAHKVLFNTGDDRLEDEFYLQQEEWDSLGIKTGVVGTMVIQLDNRTKTTKDGREFQVKEWRFIRFRIANNNQPQAPASAPTSQPEATAQQVAEGMAESAAAVEGTINPETGLPF